MRAMAVRIIAARFERTRGRTKPINMKTGKSAMQDPRMAPGKAPENAPDAMDKTMPEYPMDRNELVYPGEAEPFASRGPSSQSGRDALPHSARPLTEVPRAKLHLEPGGVKLLREECQRCITACERCADMKNNGTGSDKYRQCSMLSRACADICKLLHDHLGNSQMDEIAHMAVDLSQVCARVCEACALTCSRHTDMEICMACETACRSCADQCRQFANG